MKPSLVAPGGRVVDIILLNNAESFKIPLDGKEITVEDACILVAIHLGIGPLSRHLFSLKNNGSGEWLPQHITLQSVTNSNVFIFRLRFKVQSLRRLKEIDLTAFDYYFYQVRRDVLTNNVRNLNYEKDEDRILGLSVTDMYRVMLEDKLSLADIEIKYKSFIPKIIFKKHLFNVQIKQKVMAALERVGHIRDVWFLKEEYLTHFEGTATDYLIEEFTAQIDEKGLLRYVTLVINPFHPSQPGIQYSYSGKNEWNHLCSIEDLCFVSIREDGTIEICRKNGIPINYCFLAKSLMYSFVSLLDGYYRLSVKWTFNLCNKVYTPSLHRLHRIKCHGPVGGQFSYAKLQEKRENKPGSFILRECEKSHSVFYVDVCVPNSAKPKTYRILVNTAGDYSFSYDDKTYPSLPVLISAYKDGADLGLQLLECIPPTESDKSQVLICGVESWTSQLAAVTNPEEVLLSAPSQCVNQQSLQWFPGSVRQGRSGKTIHFRAMWKHSERSRVKVAVKELKPELNDKCLSEFLDLVGRWSCLQSNVIVKLYGITLSGKICMVTEYLDMGPLDEYLAANKQIVQLVDLVEAAATLAKALWHMEESGIVHGYIRCRKILVAAHDANTLKIKLCDPGMHKYSDIDIPWIPPECYHHMERTKTMTSADVWAFGTTLWEMFSMGKKPLTDRVHYQNGSRLRQPPDCPNAIFRVILECWDMDLDKRKTPQAIMRDIHHILHQVFNSRRVHSYATTYPGKFPSEDSHSLTESGWSWRSDATDETLLVNEVPTDELIPVDMSDANSTDMSLSSESGQPVLLRDMGPYSTQVAPDIANIPLNLQSSYNHFNERIYTLRENCNVIIQGQIGQGHYGDVYKGLLERADYEPQMVAVKQLKPHALDNTLDFEREIAIMQKLKHENIVTIIGKLQEVRISLVMEYVHNGNLHGYLRINKDVLMQKPLALLKFALDIAKGMEYLGKKKIVHRDLAARNILVANENQVKISDFGLAQFVDSTNDDYYMISTNREIPIKWHAPESLLRGRFSPRSDVWSYGVTLYEILSFGEDPQLENLKDESGPREQYEALKSNVRLPCPPGEGSQEVYRALMMPCWRFESKERPTFTAIISSVERLRIETFHCESKVGNG